MKLTLVILLFLIIQGCGIYECIDTQIDRKVKPIDKVFDVELVFNKTRMTMQIRCEEYYDALCAERGNYWAIREVGKNNANEGSRFKFTDPDFGEASVPIPSCRDMVNGADTPLKKLVPEISGENYWLVSLEKNICTLSTMPLTREKPKIIKLNWSLSVNNKPLR